MYLDETKGHMPAKDFPHTHTFVREHIGRARMTPRVVNEMARKAGAKAEFVRQLLTVLPGQAPRVQLMPLLLQGIYGRYDPINRLKDTLYIAEAMVLAYEKSKGRSTILKECLGRTLLHEAVHFAYYHSLPAHRRNERKEPSAPNLGNNRCPADSRQLKRWDLGAQFEIAIYGCPIATQYGPKILAEVRRYNVTPKEQPSSIGWD